MLGHVGVKTITSEIHTLRSAKSTGEIDLLRKAAKSAAVGFNRAMREASPGMLEKEIASHIHGQIVKEGSFGLSYEPVVASGPNALVLHYVKNMQKMKSGDLVLVDAGAIHYHYRSDISRTFPISKKFSEPQESLYSIVLEAQKACINVKNNTTSYSRQAARLAARYSK